MSRVLVTGASKGIGRATVRELAARGHDVVATARSLAALEDLPAAARLALDVTDQESVDAAFAAAGELDALISNAGETLRAPAESVPLTEVSRLFQLNTGRILVLTLAAAVSLLAAAQHADAASGPISNPHIIAHLDFSRGQTPENLALEPDGSADVTFAEAAQVARVSLDGQVRILAQLPAPAGGAACPFLGPFLGKAALTAGIVRDHQGSLYVTLCTGSPDLQGIWRVSQNGSASRIAALPADGAPNGMALDERDGFIYVADSLLSTIWRVSIADGTVVAWASGPQLAPSGGLGANGLKLHGGAVWVSNTQLGTLLRIPIRADGSAGPIETIASGLAGIDDFAFTGPGQSASVLAAINALSTVVLIRPDGSEQTVLTAADGLSNPSSVAIRGSTVYVLSAAYFTHNDPNVLLASFHR